ncbi:MAG: GNAT family N-acetyltransferase [Firmicutes bacterium]|nr:GNAT family N-acetyltransferase [Bacillota bacterium]
MTISGTKELQTDRLTLRRHVESDADLLYLGLGRDPAFSAYFGWNPYASREQARATVASFIGSYDDPRFYGWAIEREGRLIGTVGAYDYDPAANRIELGISIEQPYWGRGYAAEALRRVLDYLTAEEGLSAVFAWCAADNEGSRRAMEKAGMGLLRREREGLHINGRTCDRLIYEYPPPRSAAESG